MRELRATIEILILARFLFISRRSINLYATGAIRPKADFSDRHMLTNHPRGSYSHPS